MSYFIGHMNQSYWLDFSSLEKLAIFGILDTNLNRFNLRSLKILVHVFWKAEKFEINKFGIMCDMIETRS